MMNPLKPLRLATAALSDELSKLDPDETVLQMRLEVLLLEAQEYGLMKNWKDNDLIHDGDDRGAAKKQHAPPPAVSF